MAKTFKALAVAVVLSLGMAFTAVVADDEPVTTPPIPLPFYVTNEPVAAPPVLSFYVSKGCFSAILNARTGDVTLEVGTYDYYRNPRMREAMASVIGTLQTLAGAFDGKLGFRVCPTADGQAWHVVRD